MWWEVNGKNATWAFIAALSLAVSAALHWCFGLLHQLQQRVRYQRRKQLAKLDPVKHRATILRAMFQLEDPFIFRLGLELAFFKTYAIPSISKLLHATQETAINCLKRYEDTDLILRHMIEDGIDSERGRRALQRLNHIHGLYKIPNEQFIYVLSTFVFEPIHFFENFGWRSFTATEIEANFQYWLEVGGCMGISDIPPTAPALATWAAEYKAKHQRFATTNTAVAQPTLSLLLSTVPWGLKGIAEAAIIGMLDDDLIKALGLSQSYFSSAMGLMAKFILSVRGLAIAYFGAPLTKPRRRTPAARGTTVGATARSTELTERSTELTDPPLKPNFLVYGTCYPDGYRIEKLGPTRANSNKAQS